MTADGADREARLMLSLVGEPGDPRLSGLLAQVSATEALEFLQARGRRGELGRPWLSGSPLRSRTKHCAPPSVAA